MPDQARAPLALRALARRLARPEAPTFDLELLDGSVHRMGLGDRPAFRIALRSPRGWQALLSMDETRIGEAYMHGDLDFSGDLLAALDLRRVLSDRHPLASIWRFVQPWLLGDARADKTWVPQHYDYLSEWCATHTLPGRSTVVYESIFDYAPAERYDAIVLLGVMEHLPNYPALFRKFEALLKRGGRLYMDFAAGRRKFDVSAFTYRYIFPGDHTPVVLPELLAAAKRTALEPITLHTDRHSYFLTPQAWARNLEAAHE